MADLLHEHRWDLVVAGASFAGAACALAAAHYGLRVCVLERKRDPGLKLHTTGIIVKEAAERTWLNRIPPSLVQRVERVRLYAPSLRSLSLSAPGYYFLTTDTPNLMRWLAEELRAHGIGLRLQQPFTHATRAADGWLVEGLGETRYLIGADGAKSRVAERTGLGRVQDFLYGIEHEFAGLHLPEPDALHCFISRKYAPGYIGWVAQSPAGVQLGLALRHRSAEPQRPDIEGFRRRIGEIVGVPANLTPTATRAGLVPCGGPIAAMTAPGVMLTGDAAGIVSPVTAGGIHSAWQHGWTVGEAIALHVRGKGPAPEAIAEQAAPRFRSKRALRWAYDRFQFDWPFDLFLHSAPLRRAAELIYFHKRRT